jgi:hypothetical protein
LVLYWPHIGLHENRSHKPTHEHPRSDIDGTGSVCGLTGSGKKVLLKTKRESQTVNDVVVAEDVGNFPYKNATDALQRVSGASISREFGEGERVSTCNHLMLPS